jgi:hypothetical protein
MGFPVERGIPSPLLGTCALPGGVCQLKCLVFQSPPSEMLKRYPFGCRAAFLAGVTPVGAQPAFFAFFGIAIGRGCCKFSLP